MSIIQKQEIPSFKESDEGIFSLDKIVLRIHVLLGGSDNKVDNPSEIVEGL